MAEFSGWVLRAAFRSGVCRDGGSAQPILRRVDGTQPIAAEQNYRKRRLRDGGFSRRRAAIETEEEAAAGKLKGRLRRDVLDGPAGYIQSDKGDNLDCLMRGNAEGAVRIGMAPGVAVRHLYDSNHQHERDADDPDEGNP